jgi:hypothetical protein
MTKKNAPKTNFGMPGFYALARNQAGGDWAAGLLLYRLKWRWRMTSKLKRFGIEWVAMSRSDWAREAGLSESEMKNRALPNLRKQPFVKIRAMTVNGKKMLWMHLDEAEAFQATLPTDMHEGLLNGGMVGHHPVSYPYQKAYLQKLDADVAGVVDSTD